RALTLEQFAPACYDDPVLRKFAAERVTVAPDASLGGGQCIATVRTKDARTLTARCDYPLGAPENPMTRGQVEDKFRTYARERLPAFRSEEVIAMVAGLADLPDARALCDVLRGS